MPKIRYVAAGLSLHLYKVGLLGCVRLTTGHVICSPVTVCKNMKPRRGRNAIMEPDRTIPDRPRRRRQRPDGVAAAAATSAILSARRLGVRGASLGDSIKRNGRNLAAVPAGVRRPRIALTAVARPPHPRQRYERRRRRRPWPDICRTPEISPH